MTTLNSLFEKKTYTNAAGGCAKGVFFALLIGVFLPIVIGTVVIIFRSNDIGKSVCPHCGKPLLIQKGN